MGYSISVRFTTVQARDAMMAFLEQQPWDTLPADMLGKHLTPLLGRELGYPPKGDLERVVGFHGTEIPYSAWAVCAWMATKSGCRVNGQAGMYYDDERLIVEQADQAAADTLNTVVDARGVVVPKKRPDSLMDRMANLLSRRMKHSEVRAWVEKLDQRWEEAQRATPQKRKNPNM